MAYNEQLAARIRKVLTKHPEDFAVTEKKMFGGLAFMVNGNMCCGVMPDCLMFRLGNEGTAAALDEAHTRPMDFTGKPIKSMLYLDAPGFEADADLRAWVARAVRFARTLPAK